MSITVRNAKPDDAARIVRFLEEILKFHHNGRPDLFKELGCKYGIDEIAEKINGDRDIILIAADSDDYPVGYAICQLKTIADSPVLVSRKTLYLDDLFVEEAHRGQGIGTALIEAVTAKAKELECYNVELNVWSFNKDAQELYEKLGYTEQRRQMELFL